MTRRPPIVYACDWRWQSAAGAWAAVVFMVAGAGVAMVVGVRAGLGKMCSVGRFGPGVWCVGVGAGLCVGLGAGVGIAETVVGAGVALTLLPDDEQATSPRANSETATLEGLTQPPRAARKHPPPHAHACRAPW